MRTTRDGRAVLREKAFEPFARGQEVSVSAETLIDLVDDCDEYEALRRPFAAVSLALKSSMELLQEVRATVPPELGSRIEEFLSSDGRKEGR